MSGRVSLPQSIYSSDEKKAAFYAAALDQLRNIPGVTDAACSDALPFTGQGGESSFDIKGRKTAPGDPGPHANIRVVSAGYFHTLRIPILRGREFTPEDRASTQKVAIVDEALAKQYFPNQDPLGQEISLDEKNYFTIVGLVHHTRVSSLDSDSIEGTYYFDSAGNLSSGRGMCESVSMIVKPTYDDVNLILRLFEARREDRLRTAREWFGQNFHFHTMEEWVDESLVSQRFLVVLLSTFAGLSLFLAVLGLYGVVTYMVKMRVREIGIRMALGAQRSDVRKMILKSGAELAVIGSVLGIFATFVIGHTLSSLLYEVSLYNPATLFSTCALLAAVVLLASYLPAWRASNLNPMQTLRDN